jgi:hypothetical protein
MGAAAGQLPVFKAVDVKAVGARERAQLVEAQQAAALSKAAEAGAPLDRPRFKLPAAGAASKASGGGGGRGGGGGGGGDGRGGGETLTLGQLAQKGLQVVHLNPKAKLYSHHHAGLSTPMLRSGGRKVKIFFEIKEGRHLTSSHLAAGRHIGDGAGEDGGRRARLPRR